MKKEQVIFIHSLLLSQSNIPASAMQPSSWW